MDIIADHSPSTRARRLDAGHSWTLTFDPDGEISLPRRLGADVEVRLAVDGHLVETFTLNCDPARVEDWHGDRAACKWGEGEYVINMYYLSTFFYCNIINNCLFLISTILICTIYQLFFIVI